MMFGQTIDVLDRLIQMPDVSDDIGKGALDILVFDQVEGAA